METKETLKDLQKEFEGGRVALTKPFYNALKSGWEEAKQAKKTRFKVGLWVSHTTYAGYLIEYLSHKFE
jgi:hypothetical protein